MSKQLQIAWSKEPDKDDYAAAEKFLTLMFDPKAASQVVQRLQKAPITRYAARDILRAAGVSLLGVSDSDEERQKILAGDKISPLLLVRNDKNAQVIVADGYHRLCTVYTFDERAMVPCKIV